MWKHNYTTSQQLNWSNELFQFVEIKIVKLLVGSLVVDSSVFNKRRYTTHFSIDI